MQTVFSRSSRPHASLRLLPGLCGLVAAGLAVSGPAGATKTSSTNGSAAVAARLWSKILSRCGDAYVYPGSAFDGSGMLHNVQMNHQKALEFKGVQFHSVPIRVTAAEHANGISSRTRISMIAHLYREGDGPWMDGPGRQARNMDDMVADVLKRATGDMFDMGGGGAMTLELIGYKGGWYVRRSLTDRTGSFGFDAKLFDVEQLLAAPAPRYDCKSGRMLAPGEAE